MFSIRLEPTFLSQDELELECELREIVRNVPPRVRTSQLRNRLHDEWKGTSREPTHVVSVSDSDTELLAVRDKIQTLSAMMPHTTTDMLKEPLFHRALHLHDRLRRVSYYSDFQFKIGEELLQAVHTIMLFSKPEVEREIMPLADIVPVHQRPDFVGTTNVSNTITRPPTAKQVPRSESQPLNIASTPQRPSLVPPAMTSKTQDFFRAFQDFSFPVAFEGAFGGPSGVFTAPRTSLPVENPPFNFDAHHNASLFTQPPNQASVPSSAAPGQPAFYEPPAPVRRIVPVNTSMWDDSLFTEPARNFVVHSEPSLLRPDYLNQVPISGPVTIASSAGGHTTSAPSVTVQPSVPYVSAAHSRNTVSWSDPPLYNNSVNSHLAPIPPPPTEPIVVQPPRLSQCAANHGPIPSTQVAPTSAYYTVPQINLNSSAHAGLRWPDAMIPASHSYYERSPAFLPSHVNTRQTYAPPALQRKPINVNHWQITFSGGEKQFPTDLPLHEFLRQARMFQHSSGMSDTELLSHMMYLFRGRARSWWVDAAQHRVSSWETFVNEMRDEYVSVGHDFAMISELERYKQRDNQSSCTYLAEMEAKCQSMMTPMAESMQVYFAAKNLLSKEAVTAMANLPPTWKELRNMCKRMDLVDNASGSSKPKAPSQGRSNFTKRSSDKPRVNMIDLETARLLFTDLDIGSDTEEIVGEREIFYIRNNGKKPDDSKATSSASAPAAKDPKWALRCTHCKGTGHRAADCKGEWAPDRCFICGTEGVKVPNCPKCAGNGKANVKPEESRPPAPAQ